MDKSTVVTAGIWASGHIVIGETPPADILPLMTGPLGQIEMVLEGNTDEQLTTADGQKAWALNVVVNCTTPAERYVLVMVWLAKLAKLYADTKIIYHVNKAGNRDVRRATARAINNQLH